MNPYLNEIRFPKNATIDKNFEIRIPGLLGWDIANAMAKFNEITLSAFLCIFNVKVYNRSIAIS